MKLFRGAFLGLLFLAGCGKGPATPFTANPAEQTLDTETTVGSAAPEGPYCKPDSKGSYASSASVIDQKGENAARYWALGGGCIFRPLKEVWAITHNDASVAWKDADLITHKNIPNTAVDFFFESHYEAGPRIPFFGRTNWDMQWFQTLTQGDQKDPKYLVVKYKKNDGTPHIEFWEGSFELKALTDSVTSFVMRNEYEGKQSSHAKTMGAVTDMYARLQNLKPDWKLLGK